MIDFLRKAVSALVHKASGNEAVKDPDKRILEVGYAYEVLGDSEDFCVTLENEEGHLEQFDSVSRGWQYEWKQKGTRWLFVSAQSNSGSGRVLVRIYRDGNVVAENTNPEDASTATVSGIY